MSCFESCIPLVYRLDHAILPDTKSAYGRMFCPLFVRTSITNIYLLWLKATNFL